MAFRESKKYSLWAIFFLFAPSVLFAAEVRGVQPLTLLCMERLELLSILSTVPDENAQLERIRRGVTLLRKVEVNSKKPILKDWGEIRPLLQEPVIAVQADAVLSLILSNPQLDRTEALGYHFIQQGIRESILQTLGRHLENYDAPSPIHPISDPKEIEGIALSVFEDFQNAKAVTDLPKILEGIRQLERASGYPAIEASIGWLRAIQAVMQTKGISSLAEVTHLILGRVCVRFFHHAMKHPDQSLQLLTYLSGGDAKAFLHDVDSLRTGKLWHIVWIQQALRFSLPDTYTHTQVTIEAIQQEMQLGLYKTLEDVVELNSNILLASLEQRPPRLSDGTLLPRHHGETERKIVHLIGAQLIEPRSISLESLDALDRVALLVGDPRVDSASLLDWVQSLFGERAGFSEEQYIRFLQEANAFLPEVQRLGADRIAIFSREHRKHTDEELGASFDLWIADKATGQVVEAIEIKQTSTPRKPSDLGGILRQATQKLDGKLKTPLLSEDNFPLRFEFQQGADPLLRNLVARKKISIQFNWFSESVTEERGGVHFTTYPDGTLERWRPATASEPAKLLAKENLFQQIAEHLGKVKGMEFIDEVLLSNPSGASLAHYERRKNLWVLVP